MVGASVASSSIPFINNANKPFFFIQVFPMSKNKNERKRDKEKEKKKKKSKQVQKYVLCCHVAVLVLLIYR